MTLAVSADPPDTTLPPTPAHGQRQQTPSAQPSSSPGAPEPFWYDQFVRAYTVPVADDGDTTPNTSLAKRRATRPNQHATRVPAEKPASGGKGGYDELARPYGGWCVVIDTETTTDTTQALRFGCYELHGLPRDERARASRLQTLDRAALDTLADVGMFYDPATLGADELTTLQDYCDTHDLRLMDRLTFVRQLYEWMLRYDALVIGHNLPFDLSRLATRWYNASGEYRGGFSFQLCACEHEHCAFHPDIRIKPLGRHKAFIGLASTQAPTTTTGRGKTRRPTRAKPQTRGKFLDTATLGRALLGPGDTSLLGLGRRFRLPDALIKRSHADEHGATLTTDYLDYARQDVAATWALYQAERDLYRRHGVDAPMWRIYSEASLGKAYLQALGIRPFMQSHPDFPADVHGYGMAAYYGGRSEVKVRLQPVEVAYCDFKSQYPTVNALMGLQDLLLARTVTTRDATDDARALLANVAGPNGLALLQHPDAWRRLRVLVKLRPHGDILPVRTRFDGQSYNIGDVVVETGPDCWYTLADAVASAVRTKKPPEVVAAVELVASSERAETRPIRLFGDDRYTIDLTRQDIFTEVINLRTSVKADMKAARLDGNEQEAEYLDGLQVGLKLLANSTSYGVLVEVDADEPTTHRRPLMVYSPVVGVGQSGPFAAKTRRIEKPGAYFAGAVGAFIPAGGRLLLALAERLASDQGIGYAMCDTDSMAFTRPDGMPQGVWLAHVAEIRDYFTSLSPYTGQPPLFEDEDVNFWDGVREPLYFIGVSAKRYALFNSLPGGSFRIRKASSHGVGQYRGIGGYTPRQSIPDPPTHGPASLSAIECTRWQYDLWYALITALETGVMLSGQPLMRDGRGFPRYNPSYDLLTARLADSADGADGADDGLLATPAFHQMTISTARLYHQYEQIPGLRPFSFITVAPPVQNRALMLRHMQIDAATPDGPGDPLHASDDLRGVAFYAPYCPTLADLHAARANRRLFRMDTHQPLSDDSLPLTTLANAVENYYTHPEAKSGDPAGMGVLPRRHVRIARLIPIGKESDALWETTAQETGDTLGAWEAQNAQVFAPSVAAGSDPTALRDVATQYRIADLLLATGLPRRTLHYVLNGRQPSQTSCAALAAGLPLLAPGGPLCGWRDVPAAQLADALGWSRRDVTALRQGRQRLEENERMNVLHALATLAQVAADGSATSAATSANTPDTADETSGDENKRKGYRHVA